MSKGGIASMGSVLVTGATGLLGNVVCKRLEDIGRSVIAVDIDRGRDGNDRILTCDLGQVHRLHEIVGDLKIDTIVHCAGLSGPMVARDMPSAMVFTNIVGTSNILEVARIHKMQRVVYCSSTSAYGEIHKSGGQIREDEAMHPSSVYGASKVASEALVEAYARQYGLEGVSLRLSWVYGPRRRTDCVIKRMLIDAMNGKTTKLEFGRSFFRQYIYVEDAARALVLAVDKDKLSHHTYNITGGNFQTIEEVANIIRGLFPRASIVLEEGRDPVDDGQGQFDISAAREDLGYEPRYSMKEGIKSYADWLERNDLERKSGRIV